MEGTSNDTSTVLIVDDKSDVVDTYAIWLSDEYTIRTAYNGREALESLDHDVDVVLLDRRMPGLSGDDVLSKIRDRGIDCRVAMVTAVEPDFDILDLGFDAYLVKPVLGDELQQTVTQLLARSEYDEQMQEYFALTSKCGILEAEKSSDALAENDEYQELLERLSTLDCELSETVALFEDQDFEAAFRELDGVEDG